MRKSINYGNTIIEASSDRFGHLITIDDLEILKEEDDRAFVELTTTRTLTGVLENFHYVIYDDLPESLHELARSQFQKPMQYFDIHAEVTDTLEITVEQTISATFFVYKNDLRTIDAIEVLEEVDDTYFVVESIRAESEHLHIDVARNNPKMQKLIAEELDNVYWENDKTIAPIVEIY